MGIWISTQHVAIDRRAIVHVVTRETHASNGSSLVAGAGRTRAGAGALPAVLMALLVLLVSAREG